MIIDRFLYYFFAPNGRFEPCGMFTVGHKIAAIICISIVIISVILMRKKSDAFIHKLTRVAAYVFTVLELIKISHSFLHQELQLDAWFPLSYCGLFIFALWMAGYAKGFFKRAGESFIAYGCPVAGIAFIIFPTTSLMNFPLFHYLSLYSLFFHTTMITLGVLYIFKDSGINRKKYASYLAFVLFFSVISVAMNNIFGCNLMNLREPYNIPIEFIQNLYSASAYLYTLSVLIIYSIIPFFVAFIGRKT